MKKCIINISVFEAVFNSNEKLYANLINCRVLLLVLLVAPFILVEMKGLGPSTTFVSLNALNKISEYRVFVRFFT